MFLDMAIALLIAALRLLDRLLGSPPPVIDEDPQAIYDDIDDYLTSLGPHGPQPVS